MATWRDRVQRRYTSDRLEGSRRLVGLAKLIFLGVVIIIVGSLVIIPLLAFTLPSPDKIVRQEGYSTQILDRNGKALYDIYENQRRTPVEFNDIPLTLRQATIAIEDKNFYQHQGFDPVAPFRIFYNFLFKGRVVGGSTLTQQLVKNTLLSPERTIFRKVREFILAIQIERKFTKDEILQMYLNESPYGGTAWGVEAAAETYFGKKVKDLNLVESAILAGLPQRPSTYSPFSSTPKAYVGRTQEVLRRMREDGYITRDQEKDAVARLEGFKFQDKGASFKAPHFVQYVQKILEDRYGPEAVQQGGLKVTTSLDLDLQDKAQAIVAEEVAKSEKLHITNGAAVVLNPETGEILAMVGSKDFNAPDYDGQVNVTLSLRQPGSAIKPITYVTAFKKGYTPSTLLMDVPTTFPGGVGQPEYKPVNYDGKYRGPIQVRYALGNSINIPAVKMLARVGIKDTLQTAFDLGITSLEPTKETLSRVGLSLTLGGGEVRLLELTGAYGAFLNEGYKVEPVAILKVEDNSGKVLEEVHPQKDKRVLTAEQAFLIANILSDNKAREIVFGSNSLLNISGRTVAVKTGTTNDRRDNWALGGNDYAVVGAWVGNNDNSPMGAVASGVSGATPIWRRIVIEALAGKPNIGFKAPDGIITASVDSVSGFRAHDGYPSRPELFIKGMEPGDDPIHVKLKVCKTDGKLATPGDIASGNYEEKEYFAFKEEDPTAGPGGENKWQKGILEWLLTQSDPRYHPPTDYCGSSNPISLDFVTPHDNDGDLPSDFPIEIQAASTSDIDTVDLYIDGNRVRTFTGAPFTYNTSDIRPPLSNGPHKLKAHARDKSGHEAEREITVGVNGPAQTPTPAPTPSPTPNL